MKTLQAYDIEAITQRMIPDELLDMFEKSKK